MGAEITLINKTDTASIRLEYNPNFKFNSKLSFPFKITENYSQLNLPIDE